MQMLALERLSRNYPDADQESNQSELNPNV